MALSLTFSFAFAKKMSIYYVAKAIPNASKNVLVYNFVCRKVLKSTGYFETPKVILRYLVVDTTVLLGETGQL